MSKAYDDPRYGIERVLIAPIFTFAAASVTGAHFKIDLEDKITLIEFGVNVITAISTGNTTAASIQLREGSTVYGVLSIPTTSALAALITTRSLTASALVNSTTLTFQIFMVATAGAIAPFIRYKARPG